MDVPARLKWRKEEHGFFAYPMTGVVRNCYARIHFSSKTVRSAPSGAEVDDHWHWMVHWEGWFQRTGWASSKQAAADRATEAWWEMLQTELPRDWETEAMMIAARVLVRPPPNSLFGDETEVLQKVVWHLRNIYANELKAEAAPQPVANLLGRLSEELLQRRGGVPEPEPIVTRHRRRR